MGDDCAARAPAAGPGEQAPRRKLGKIRGPTNGEDSTAAHRPRHRDPSQPAPKPSTFTPLSRKCDPLRQGPPVVTIASELLDQGSEFGEQGGLWGFQGCFGRLIRGCRLFDLRLRNRVA